MAYEINNGDLSLWINDRKESDRHPDYKGKALIDGTLYDVAVWSRTDRNGNQYYSGKIEVRQQAQHGGAPTQEARTIAGARQVSGQSIYRNPPRQAESFDPQPNDLPFD